MSERIDVLPPARNEQRDVRFKYVAAGASWLALAMALALLWAWWLFPHTMTDQYVARPVPQFAQPQLQSSPRLDMERFTQQQMKALNGVYWLDQGRGVVHLPIADAMRKVAEEGIPDWPTPPPAAKPAAKP